MSFNLRLVPGALPLSRCCLLVVLFLVAVVGGCAYGSSLIFTLLPLLRKLGGLIGAAAVIPAIAPLAALYWSCSKTAALPAFTAAFAASALVVVGAPPSV